MKLEDKTKKNLKNAAIATGILLGTTFVVMRTIAKKQQPKSVYADQPEEQNPVEGKKVVFVENENEPENADGKCGHLQPIDESEHLPTFYEKYVKRGFDIVLSFGGLVVLSPIYAATALAIKADDPGPVIFKQKRVAQNKGYFQLLKFRSMSVNTPKDVPTHMLQNGGITKVGAFIRKTSIDELPQLWNIFLGNMSIIGPRPALWNQDYLTAERDKYGANDVKPGLTGLAQISGRDELEIEDKAKLDGVYAKELKKSSINGFLMDCKMFIGSISSVLRSSGVVEGGTGAIAREFNKAEFVENGDVSDAGFEDYGFRKVFSIDKNKKLRVLITGADSYIGTSFEAWAKENYPNLEIETVDMIDGTWREKDFSGYDVVFHVAGLAHADVGHVDDATKQKYYAVNTDLAIETAEKAKKDGVRQFVFMSSIIIYGDSAGYGDRKVITATTVPSPANFYGDSKWQADKGVRKLATEDFNVAVLRPPMIYGRGSKGNYPTLAKLAKKLPVFPNVDNERSMLHIDNLTEFLCQLMLSGMGGIYFPQNAEYTKTSDMVRMISHVVESNITETKVLNPFVVIGSKVHGKVSDLVHKAFGSLTIDQALSNYEGIDYRVNGLKESIEKTESKSPIKRVLFLVNHEVVIYNFRLEIVEELLRRGYEVHISCPYGERIEELKALGAIWHDLEVERHGMNPAHEIQMIRDYEKLYDEVQPSIVLGFTIKPNIYGAIAAKHKHIPFVANITGLGTAVETPGKKQFFFMKLYKFAFSDIQRVFFQNTENQRLFIDNKVAMGKHKLIPGSGVNVDRYPVREYPSGDVIRFAFISRIMKEKGIDQYLEAAKAIKEKYPNTEFHVCGFCEDEYEGQLDSMNDNGTVIYHGMIDNVSEFLTDIHCVIHPTYYPEGLSNVLLEASASGRPIITTDRSGCREVIDDGINGFMIPQKDAGALFEAIEKFLKLSNGERKAMGLAGRTKVENEFNRQIVVDAYMEEVEKV